MIKAGELRDKIVFEASSTTVAGNGDISYEWEELISTFAKVREKSGGYSYETGSLNGQSRITIVIRYRPDVPITIGNRVQWRGFSWIVSNSPIVDYLRTSITMEATLQIANSNRTSEPENNGFPYTLPFNLA